MKKILFIFLITMVSCNQNIPEPSQETLSMPYEATYQKEWKMGSQENVLLVQNFHKALLDGEFEKAYELCSDTISMWNGDGTSVEGLDNLKTMLEGYKEANLRDYGVGVNIPVVSEEGHEWVLLWDIVTFDGPDGAVTERYQEAFRIADGKIVAVNQFSKPVLD